MTARPIQLWPLCKFFDPRGLGRNYITYIRTYCDAHNNGFGMDTSGASNLDELQYKLRTVFMIRRDKREVMGDLPPKERQIVVMPDDGIQKRVEQELSAVRRLVANFEKMMELAPAEDTATVDRRFWETVKTVQGRFIDNRLELKSEFNLAFEELSLARKELALAKVPLACQYIDGLIDSGEKVIVFCHHRVVADELKKHYPNCAFISGKVPTQKRQAQVDRFQEDTACNPLISTLDAGGEGFTMTAATHVVCVEFSFNPSKMEQAEDRAWRDGQENSVTVHYLVVDGSFDARNIYILEDKAEVLEKALDTKNLQSLTFLADILTKETES